LSKPIKILLGLLIVVFIVLMNLIAYRIIFFRADAEVASLKNNNYELQLLLEECYEKVTELEIESSDPLIHSDNLSDNDIFEMKGLIEVRTIDPTIVVDLIYATDQNFTDQVLYKVEVCLLARGTAEKLAAANAEFARNGYRIKVWDAYRPREVQVTMWENQADGVYVADPSVGSNHNRGAAVDLTLVDLNGSELEMPTKFDVFDETASRNYSGMTDEARKNMDYMTEVMTRNGFKPIQAEWWHFNDEDLNKYDFLAITLEEWVNGYFAHIYKAKR